MESDLVLACELISCTQELTCELVRQLVDENSPTQRRALGERVMTYQGFIDHMQAQIRNE